MLHLKNLDVEPFAFDAAFTRDEGVSWQYILSDTHRLQEPEPHTLTADDRLVAMHTRLDGVTCCLLRCFAYRSVKATAYGLCHPCYHHRVAYRLSECRHYGSRYMTYGLCLRLATSCGGLHLLGCALGGCSSTSGHILRCKLV